MVAQYPNPSRIDDDRPIAVKDGLVVRDPLQAKSLLSQVAATGTITITGTETNGDVLTVTFTSQQLPSGTHQVSITTAGSETLSQIATDLKNAINNDQQLAGLGITASSVGAVVTITWIAGPLGNFATMAFTKSGGATEGATVVQFSGGSGYITPQQDASIAIGGSLVKLVFGQPRLVDYNALKKILAAGITVL